MSKCTALATAWFDQWIGTGDSDTERLAKDAYISEVLEPYDSLIAELEAENGLITDDYKQLQLDNKKLKLEASQWRSIVGDYLKADYVENVPEQLSAIDESINAMFVADELTRMAQENGEYSLIADEI